MALKRTAKTLPDTRRITDDDFSDAPAGDYQDAIKDSVNKLVDRSNAAQLIQATPLANNNLEIVDFNVQIPSPLVAVGSTAVPYAGTWAGFSQGSYIMRDYTGMVTLFLSATAGAAATVMFMPTGYVPITATTAVVWDETGGIPREMTVDSASGVQISATTGHTIRGSVSFMSVDVTPQPAKCWPQFVQTGLTNIKGVCVVRVQDGGGDNRVQTSNRSPGQAFSVDWTLVTQRGVTQVRINNINGLPYSRKSIVSLLLIGDS